MKDRKTLVMELLEDMHVMKQRMVMNCGGKKDLGITPTQGVVLRFIEKQEGVKVKTIAEALHITSSAVTQLVEGLVEKGYVIRTVDSQDRRALVLKLSPKTKKLFTAFHTQTAENMLVLFEALTDQELLQYTQLNKKIADYLKVSTR